MKKTAKVESDVIRKRKPFPIFDLILRTIPTVSLTTKLLFFRGFFIFDKVSVNPLMINCKGWDYACFCLMKSSCLLKKRNQMIALFLKQVEKVNLSTLLLEQIQFLQRSLVHLQLSRCWCIGKESYPYSDTYSCKGTAAEQLDIHRFEPFLEKGRLH